MKMLAVAVMLLGAMYGFSQEQKDRKVERIELREINHRVMTKNHDDEAERDPRVRSKAEVKRVPLPRHEALLKQNDKSAPKRLHNDGVKYQQLKRS